METTPEKPPDRRKRWGWWTFIILNLLGIIILIPVMKPVMPLLRVWWNTRSQESLRLSQAAHRPSSQPQESGTNPVLTSKAAPAQAIPGLEMLTNQLTVLEQFSDLELADVVSKNFGMSGPPSTNTGHFDLASAVFDSISKTTVVYRGTTYHAYLVNLVDQDGNHKTNLDCFLEPNLEYERSLAAMELINRSPQLKRIYRAMAGSLAEQSAPDDIPEDAESTNGPVLRLNPDSTPVQP